MSGFAINFLFVLKDVRDIKTTDRTVQRKSIQCLRKKLHWC